MAEPRAISTGLRSGEVGEKHCATAVHATRRATLLNILGFYDIRKANKDPSVDQSRVDCRIDTR